MKGKFKILVGVVVILILSFFTINIYHILTSRSAIEKNFVMLPAFSFEDTNHNIFNSRILNGSDKRIIINFFSPNCEHCQYMVNSFITHKEELMNTIIVMVTTESATEVAKFNSDYKVYTAPYIYLLRDTRFEFYKKFGTMAIPSFFVYENGKLLKKIIGETKIENLIN